jgi:hypothetical protein
MEPEVWLRILRGKPGPPEGKKQPVQTMPVKGMRWPQRTYFLLHDHCALILILHLGAYMTIPGREREKRAGYGAV